MAKTLAEITAQALYDLGVAQTGQPIQADEAAVFDLQTVADYLKALRIADLTGAIRAGDIGDEWFFPFSKLAAAQYCLGFGWTQEQQSALEAEALAGLRGIANRARPVHRAFFERMTY